MFIAARLAKAGYCNGDPEQVLRAPVEIFKAMIDYEAFEAEYEREYIALNQSEGGR